MSMNCPDVNKSASAGTLYNVTSVIQTINTVSVRFKITNTKSGIAGTPLVWISQLINNLSCMRFLQLSYNFAMSCL